MVAGGARAVKTGLGFRGFQGLGFRAACENREGRNGKAMPRSLHKCLKGTLNPCSNSEGLML